MTDFKNTYILMFLTLTLCIVPVVSAMQVGVPFEQLVEEEDGVPLREATVEFVAPKINIPKQKFCDTGTAVGGFIGGAGSVACKGFGVALIVENPTDAKSIIMGTILLVCGSAIDIALLAGAIKHKRTITRKNADLDEYIPYAQAAIARNRTLPWHLGINDESLNLIYNAAKTNDKATLSDIVCSFDILANWSRATDLIKRADFLQAARQIVETLPAPLAQQPQPQAEPFAI